MNETSTRFADKLYQDVSQTPGTCMAENKELLVPSESGVTSLCQVNGVDHRSLNLMMVSGERAYVEAGNTTWQKLTVQRTKYTPVHWDYQQGPSSESPNGQSHVIREQGNRYYPTSRPTS